MYPGQTVAVVGRIRIGQVDRRRGGARSAARGGRITGGRIAFDGDGPHARRIERTRRSVRGTGIGYVPQDPMTNLNPVWKVGFQIREALRANDVTDRAVARARSVQLLTEVGMHDPAVELHQYPHSSPAGCASAR